MRYGVTDAAPPREHARVSPKETGSDIVQCDVATFVDKSEIILMWFLHTGVVCGVIKIICGVLKVIFLYFISDATNLTLQIKRLVNCSS